MKKRLTTNNNVLLIKKGRTIKYKGMPFKLEHDTLVYGGRKNMNLANAYDENKDATLTRLNNAK